MSDGDFVKVFDVLDAGYRDWSFAAFGLIFVAIGMAVLFFPSVIKATGLSFLDFKSKWRKGFSYFYIGFAPICAHPCTQGLLPWTICPMAIDLDQ